MGLGIKTKVKTLKDSIIYANNIVKTKESKYLRVLLLCHSLEKGMGIPHVKHGYGQEKAKTLIKLLGNMRKSGDSSRYEYKEALAILKAYFKYQEENGVDVLALKKEAGAILDDRSEPYLGGYRVLDSNEFLKAMNIDAEGFICSRHSMRAFSDEEISPEEMNKVVKLAQRAPSACNREPWKFYYSRKHEITKLIANALPYQNFMDEIPYIGVVTVDKALFNLNEVNQWYINGGIFAAFLVLSFHSIGIGSCIFQYPVYSKSKENLKALLGIPACEEIICGVGFGKYPKEAKCIFADRRPTESVLIEVE